jgi:hypothetical protein
MGGIVGIVDQAQYVGIEGYRTGRLPPVQEV